MGISGNLHGSKFLSISAVRCAVPPHTHSACGSMEPSKAFTLSFASNFLKTQNNKETLAC